MVTAPILVRPEFTTPFVLQTDASGVGLGAVLMQRDELGKEHGIVFAAHYFQFNERH